MAFNVILSVWMSVKSILMSNNRDTSFLGRYLNWIQGTRMKILSIHLLSFFIFSQAAYADFWDWLTPTPNVPAHSVSDHQVQSASCLTERLTRYGKSDLFFLFKINVCRWVRNRLIMIVIVIFAHKIILII